MKPGLRRTMLVEVIRYFGVTQACGVVILHGAWMLLALAVWQHANVGTAPNADLTRPLLRAFAWLGGTDGQGVGSGSNLLVVWGKISVVVYLIEALARRVVGPRAPFRLRVVAAASGGIALLGYGLSFLSASSAGDITGLMLLSVLLAVLAAGAAAWTVLARRFAELAVRRIEAPESAPPMSVGQT